MNVRFPGAAALALLMASGPAIAHPHVFIDYAVTVGIAHGLPDQLRMVWTYDDMYSDLVRHDLVKGDGTTLTAAEKQAIRQRTFDDLAPAHYFTEVHWNGQSLAVGTAAGFDVRFTDGRAVYSFSLPLKAEVSSASTGSGTLDIGVFDPEYYVQFTYDAEKPPRTMGDEGGRVRCTVTPSTRTARMFGPVDSDLVVCRDGNDQ